MSLVADYSDTESESDDESSSESSTSEELNPYALTLA